MSRTRFATVLVLHLLIACTSPAADPEKLYDQAIALEKQLELTRAATVYEEILGICPSPRLAIDAQQGLLRIEDLRAEFSLDRAELARRLAKTYQPFTAADLDDWERRGWVYSRAIDGTRRYSLNGVTNIRFFSTELMARSAQAKEYRQFAQLFLDASARLDRLRAASPVPACYVNPVRFVYTVREEIREADLPPGPTVRAWFPCPLLSPATQNIRVLSVSPAGAMRFGPDLEGDLGVVYVEVPRPASGDLMIELRIAFDSYDSDFHVDPGTLPPYGTQSDLYRRFTRSEPQMEQTRELGELARSIVGQETNAYRKARKLYDWVCDHITYNYVWRWRDATFCYGNASEEVRQRRVGDCVVQSVFYAALCRCVGLPARVHNGPIFPPGMKNDHVWAEVYMPGYGWLPVDVTYSEVASMVPGLTPAERRTIRDFFFGRLDRYRFITQRNQLAQELIPAKQSVRRRVTMFVRPELECGAQNVAQHKASWECQPAK
jgi:transglutaminase-like putative cysteine protease